MIPFVLPKFCFIEQFTVVIQLLFRPADVEGHGHSNNFYIIVFFADPVRELQVMSSCTAPEGSR